MQTHDLHTTAATISSPDSRGVFAPSISADWPGLVVARGLGSYLYTSSGDRVLDFTSGIGVTNTGHCHPRVTQAATEQVQQLIHAAAGVAYAEPLLRLRDELPAVMPKGLDAFFFGNSGAEAVEGAIKLARHATGRPGIIAFLGGFHGRTYGAASVTSVKARYRSKYEPFLPSVYFAPYADPFHGIAGVRGDDVVEVALEGLNTVLDHLAPPSQVAAILIEPIQGEAGYIVPPRRFLESLRSLCDETGILLILDEVQSGFGRTGEMFAAQTFDVRPDIMAVAKGIASGFPLSATVASRALMERWSPGSHGTTFGGNPVACAAALATLDVIREEHLLENCRNQGTALVNGLRSLAADSRGIADVRGVGLMIGIEFASADGPSSAAGLTQRFLDGCLRRGLLLYVAGAHGEVARLIPPLTVSDSEVADALTIMAEALHEVSDSPQ